MKKIAQAKPDMMKVKSDCKNVLLHFVGFWLLPSSVLISLQNVESYLKSAEFHGYLFRKKLLIEISFQYHLNEIRKCKIKLFTLQYRCGCIRTCGVNTELVFWLGSSDILNFWWKKRNSTFRKAPDCESQGKFHWNSQIISSNSCKSDFFSFYNPHNYFILGYLAHIHVMYIFFSLSTLFPWLCASSSWWLFCPVQTISKVIENFHRNLCQMLNKQFMNEYLMTLI